jgi:hypothetical protein
MTRNRESRIVEKLTLLCSTGQELASINDRDILLEKLLDASLDMTNSAAASILMTDRKSEELYFRTAGGSDANRITKVRFRADKGIAGWVIKNREPVIVNDISRDPGHYGYIDKAVNYKTRKLICVPIIWENEVIGILEAINKKSRGGYNDQDLEFLTILANHAGSSMYIAEMFGKLQNFFVNMLELMMVASETLAVNPGHSVRVARLATRLAREIGVSEKEYREIYYASLIHDIGRIKIAKDQIVGGEKLIPSLGAEMIRPIIILQGISNLVESCEERWDGSGSPRGLHGAEIPLGARIIGLVEDFEKWKEEVAYHKQFEPLFHEDFYRKIERTHDPDLVQAFKDLRRKEREKFKAQSYRDFAEKDYEVTGI